MNYLLSLSISSLPVYVFAEYLPFSGNANCLSTLSFPFSQLSWKLGWWEWQVRSASLWASASQLSCGTALQVCCFQLEMCNDILNILSEIPLFNIFGTSCLQTAYLILKEFVFSFLRQDSKLTPSVLMLKEKIIENSKANANKPSLLCPCLTLLSVLLVMLYWQFRLNLCLACPVFKVRTNAFLSPPVLYTLVFV